MNVKRIMKSIFAPLVVASLSSAAFAVEQTAYVCEGASFRVEKNAELTQVLAWIGDNGVMRFDADEIVQFETTAYVFLNEGWDGFLKVEETSFGVFDITYAERSDDPALSYKSCHQIEIVPGATLNN